MKDDLLAWISSGYADSRLHFFGSIQMYVRDVNNFLFYQTWVGNCLLSLPIIETDKNIIDN